MNEPKPRALLYARVSTEAQAGEDRTSLDSQLEACRALAQANGWEVVNEVRDTKSGYSLDRPGLDEVRAWAKQGRFDLFVAHKQERMSRSQVDTAVLDQELTKAGVRIWTVQEGTFEDTPLGRYLRQTYAFAAEMDRAQRKEATSRGQREKVKAGKLLGSSPKPAYGYDWVYDTGRDGKPVKVAYSVNEEQAEVVRRIYAEAVTGRSVGAITRGLNLDAVPSPFAGQTVYQSSGLWGAETVTRMLRNPFYSGRAYGMVHSGRGEQGHRSLKRRFEQGDAIQLPEGVVPAIVDRTLWERVQDVLDNRLPGGPTPADPDHTLLRGIARCGICNRTMALKTRGTGKKYLRCSSGSAGRTPCNGDEPSPSIKLEWLKEPVWELVRSVLLDPYKLHDRFESGEQVEAEQEQLAGVEARLAGVKQRRSRLIRSLELLEDEDAEELRPRLAELAEERDGLTRQAEALRARLASRSQDRDRLERLVTWARQEVERVDELTVEERRAVLLELGVVVRVYPKKAPERFTVEIGARYTGEDYFEDVDDDGEPTPGQREETARLEREAAERGREAGLVERSIRAGSPTTPHTLGFAGGRLLPALAVEGGRRGRARGR